MRKVLLLVVLTALVIVSCTNKNAYTVTGTFATADFDGKTVYLQQRDYGAHKMISIDSVQVKQGQFKFQGIASDTSKVCFIQFSDQARLAAFVAEPGDIKVTINEDLVSKVNGTQINNDYQSFTDKVDKVFAEGQKMYEQTTEELAAGKINHVEAESRKDSMLKSLQSTIYDFVKPNSQNALGEFLLVDYVYYLTPAQTLELISATRSKFQSFEDIKMIQARAKAQLATEIGQPFIDIKGKNFEGNTVSLSDFVGKGNVVLVDFWASWCGPCIRSLPGLIETYEQYKDKGLTIVGVSLDDKMDAWKGATERLKISWPQFSNLKGWEDEVAIAYGINSIPATILISKEGIILNKNLEPEELKNKLKELLN